MAGFGGGCGGYGDSNEAFFLFLILLLLLVSFMGVCSFGYATPVTKK